MKKYILLLIFAVLSAAGVWYFCTSDSDEAKVKRVLKTLCRMATKRSGDNPAAAGLMISKTDKIFAGEFTVKIGNGMFDGVYNPTKMTSELARYRAAFSEVDVDAQDMEISFPAPNKAEIVFTGVLNGRSKTGTPVSEAREVICTLYLTQEGWRIKQIVIKEIMQR